MGRDGGGGGIADRELEYQGAIWFEDGGEGGVKGGDGSKAKQISKPQDRKSGWGGSRTIKVWVEYNHRWIGGGGGQLECRGLERWGMTGQPKPLIRKQCSVLSAIVEL